MAVDLSEINRKAMYSVSETAQFLDKTEQTVRLYIKTGTLTAKKGNDNRWRITGDEILKFIDGKTV